MGNGIRINRRPAFNNYDPRLSRRSTFDPRMNNMNGNNDPAYTTEQAAFGNKMQVSLIFNNATASNITFEAWNWIDSFLKYRKANYAVGNYLYIPQDSFEGISAIAANTDQTVGFDTDGNLVIRGLAADPVATLTCKETSYRSFFDASGIVPFRVSGIRYKSTNDAQKDEKIVHFEKTFAGGVKENPISPRAFEKPTDEKENLIDIPVEFPIDVDKGIRMVVLAGQAVTLSLFISDWTNQSL